MNALERLLIPRVRGAWKLWLAALVAIAATCWAGVEAGRLHQAVQGQQARVDQLRATLRRPAPPKMSRDDRQREKQWAAMKAERDFRWYPIFKALEDTASPDIELLEFAPDKVNGTFILRGEARNAKALLAYLGALAAQPSFKQVYLAHQKNVPQGQVASIGFELKGALR